MRGADGAAAGPVALHGIDRVDDGVGGGDDVGQLEQHFGKLPLIGIEAVQLGLLEAGHGAEEVFHGAGHDRHPMGFELGEVDDEVGVDDRGQDIEAARALFMDALEGEILVEGIGFVAQADGAVDGVHPGGGVGAAGAVGHHDFGDPARAQVARHGGDQGGMGGDGGFGGNAAQHIHFQQNPDSGAELLFAHCGEMRRHGAIEIGGGIGRGCLAGNATQKNHLADQYTTFPGVWPPPGAKKRLFENSRFFLLHRAAGPASEGLVFEGAAQNFEIDGEKGFGGFIGFDLAGIGIDILLRLGEGGAGVFPLQEHAQRGAAPGNMLRSLAGGIVGHQIDEPGIFHHGAQHLFGGEGGHRFFLQIHPLPGIGRIVREEGIIAAVAVEIFVDLGQHIGEIPGAALLRFLRTGGEGKQEQKGKQGG